MKKSICLVLILFLFTFVYSADLKFDGSNKIKTGSLVKGLVGRWSLSQQSVKATSPDTILADLTPYGNDGVVYGATFTTDQKGQSNRAMSFDGENDYVDCWHDTSLDITDVITISAWVKLEDRDKERQDILSKRKEDHICNYLLEIYNGYIGFYFCNSGWKFLEDNTELLNNNVWYHIVATYDRDKIRLYLDGEEIKNKSENTIMLTNDFAVHVGNMGYINSRNFDGSISDVRIYNRALSPAEITLLYESYRLYFIMSGE